MEDILTIETSISYGMVLFSGKVPRDPFKKYRDDKFRRIREELEPLGFKIISEIVEHEVEWDRLIIRAVRPTGSNMWAEQVHEAMAKKKNGKKKRVAD